MKNWFLPLVLATGLQSFGCAVNNAHATSYAGNGGTGFNGAVGSGILNVTNNGSGGVIFAFTLGGAQTNLGGNDIEIYIATSTAGGIGTSTAGLTDTGDGGRKGVSEYTTTDNGGGVGRSTLTFGALMSPQFALDLSVNTGNIYSLANGASFGYDGGQTVGSAVNNGAPYTVSPVGGNTVFSLNIPAADIGLSSFSGATLKFVAIQVSETGFSSNEATVALSGASGYGGTQTIASVNSFTLVPEPRTWAMVLLGAAGLLFFQRRGRLLR